MDVPGSNLLLMAMECLEWASVVYYAQTGRTLETNGIYATTYATGVPVDETSVQVIPRNLYDDNGLDYQKNYIYWFVPVDVMDLQRDNSGDRIGVTGRKYQLTSETDWFNIDGWTVAMCVDIGVDNGAG